MNNQNNISTRSPILGGQMFAVAVLFTFAAAGNAFADNISKTFEFGSGMAQTRSNVRTFPIPCNLEVAAVVKFRREGPGTAASDIPIKIELRKPDTGPDQEGPIAKEEDAIVKPGEQTVILRVPGTNRGCSSPWRVRIQHLTEGPAPFRTYGTIRLDFDGGVRAVPPRQGASSLKKGQSTTAFIGREDTVLGHGFFEITSNWVHTIGGVVQGPNPVKLRFELIDPNGAVVKKVEAYSSIEARIGLPKFNLIYQVTHCVPGPWSVRITNIDPDNDADNVSPKIKFTPDCP